MRQGQEKRQMKKERTPDTPGRMWARERDRSRRAQREELEALLAKVNAAEQEEEVESGPPWMEEQDAAQAAVGFGQENEPTDSDWEREQPGFEKAVREGRIVECVSCGSIRNRNEECDCSGAEDGSSCTPYA